MAANFVLDTENAGITISVVTPSDYPFLTILFEIRDCVQATSMFSKYEGEGERRQ